VAVRRDTSANGTTGGSPSPGRPSGGPAAATSAGRRWWRARSTPATVGVVLVFGAAGILFATSAQTARGTQLRTDRTDLASVIRSENVKAMQRSERVAALTAEIDARTGAEAGVNSDVAARRAQAARIAPDAGLSPVEGRGLVVTLNDAPRGGTRPAGALPDDLVVHQQDVQAVVNALWAGGATALMVMDQRVISTSAVRCVGNTLILQGRVYSPPYRVAAVGDPARLRTAMDASPSIPIYLEYVRRYGLGWNVADRSSISMPAYSGPLQLQYARPLTAATPTPSSSSR
jgi:uncharacterized protein YlxW (UPF0749 family)